MSEWVMVNGAWIEREFFEQNVCEAKSYEWVRITSNELVNHAHCMVCGISLDSEQSKCVFAYKTTGGHLCEYCFDHFISQL